eukprot:scaffold127415_cov63-Phaeocystis_antarctica.AAC.1
MSVTLDVSKLNGWLNAYALCRESKGGHTVREEVQARCGTGGGRRWATAAHAACTREGSTADWGLKTWGGAHVEHLAHGCDFGGIPAGNVRVEIVKGIEELAHVGDDRDVPADDGSVRLSGGSWVSVERPDRRLQGGLSRECGRAGPRTPARAILRGEGRGARPRAPDEQLVGVGQGVCVLPRVERKAYDAGRGAHQELGGGGRP